MSRNAQYRTLNRPLSIFLCLLPLFASRAEAQLAFTPESTNAPRARVVIVEDSGATSALLPVPEKIQSMVDRAMTNLTGLPTVSAAWRSLVTTQDTVGLKVFSTPGEYSGTRPAVAAAVVQELLAAGVPANHIILWDKRMVDLRLAGYTAFERRYGIRVLGAADTGYDENMFYETALVGPMSWTDREFGRKGTGVGRKSYVAKIVSREITKIVNITPMIHNNLTGVSGHLYSLVTGAVDNTMRFENSPDALARAVPEIYALTNLSDHVVLNITDALICQYEGQDTGLLHYSTILNQLRFSRDPVALDVLSLREISHQSETAGVPMTAMNPELYANAALMELGVNDPRHIQVDRIQ